MEVDLVIVALLCTGVGVLLIGISLCLALWRESGHNALDVQALQPFICSRLPRHEGPCNGWPRKECHVDAVISHIQRQQQAGHRMNPLFGR